VAGDGDGVGGLTLGGGVGGRHVGAGSVDGYLLVDMDVFARRSGRVVFLFDVNLSGACVGRVSGRVVFLCVRASAFECLVVEPLA